MKQTINYNFAKPELNDSPPDITVMNPNWDTIDVELKSHDDKLKNLAAYAVAIGTNTYTSTIAGITTLTEGFSIKIKFTNANTGASTLNINSLGAKSILKGNGSALSSGNIKAGQICNLVYNGLNFQLLGEGGEYGTATASDVLSGRTIGTDTGIIEGTIPIKEAATITPGTVSQAIAAGQYLKGIQTIAGDSDLVPSNIKSGVDIFGVSGTAQIPSGSALAAQVLAGYTFSNVSGVGLNGSMPNQGNIAATLTTQGQQYTVQAGYHAGAGKVIANISNLIASNIKSGVNVGGVVGVHTGKDSFTYTSLFELITKYWSQPNGNFGRDSITGVISMYRTGSASGANNHWATTDGAIVDLTYFNYIEVIVRTDASRLLELGINPTNIASGNSNGELYATQTVNGIAKIKLDVSNKTGNYLIYVKAVSEATYKYTYIHNLIGY